MKGSKQMIAQTRIFKLIYVMPALLLSCLPGAVRADDSSGPQIQTIPLSTCLVAELPATKTALDGDTQHTIPELSYDNDSQIFQICLSYPCDVDCGSGNYWGQTLDYLYTSREVDELIVTPAHGAPIIKEINKDTPMSESYGQRYNHGLCQSRADFSAEALAYFNGYFENEIKPRLCK
jgi:hypothetical protein